MAIRVQCTFDLGTSFNLASEVQFSHTVKPLFGLSVRVCEPDYWLKLSTPKVTLAFYPYLGASASSIQTSFPDVMLLSHHIV